MILGTMSEVIKNIWPMMVIFLVVLVAIRISYLKINSEKFIFYKEFGNLIFVIYVMLLFELLTSTEMNTNSGYNLVPFTEIFRYQMGTHLFMINVIGNICIFIPFGYFVSMYIKASKLSHILFISLITSLTVEMVQLQIGRSFDIDDVFLNVAGSIIGFILFISLSAIKRRLPKFLQSDNFYNLICLSLFIGAFIYFSKLIGLGWFNWI